MNPQQLILNSPALMVVMLVIGACSNAGAPAATGLVEPSPSEHDRTLAEANIDSTDYQAAERLLETKLIGLVKNITVTPNWLERRSAFWYKREADEGHEYVLVDVTSGEKSPLFNHEALAGALSGVLELAVTATQLGLSKESLNDNIDNLTAETQGKSVTCDLTAMSCSAEELRAPDPSLLNSPGRSFSAKSHENNLYLVDTATGEERQLTSDGEHYYSWGKLPDSSLITIPNKKSGRKMPPFGASFSPDDRYLIAPRIDERKVAVNPFVEWVPTDGSMRPVMHQIRTTFAGDRDRLVADNFIFDTLSGKAVPILVPEEYRAGLGATPLGWSVERGQAFMVAGTLGLKKSALFRVDLATGQGEMIVEESSDIRVEANSYMYNRPTIWIIGDGEEVIWYSDRSGWGHLYLYDAQTGELKTTITSGAWLVQDIHRIDEENRNIYFTGGGREAGRDPYFRHLYRVPIDGGEVTLLTVENADHHFAPVPSPQFAMLFGLAPPQPVIRPDLGVLIDTWSTVDRPPVTVLRSTVDGSIVAQLEAADASALFETGWTAPVRHAVKAADGETDIYTVYWAPQRELPGGKHPVIDSAYGGPQVIVAPRNFVDAFSGRNPYGQAAQARLGFAVVTTDGRGTPLRSNAFRDAGYTEFTQVGIDDHIAAIEHLADKYPAMDTSRVGIHGWSWGGTFSGQAILSRPEFFDVAVTGAGVYDYIPLYPGFEFAAGIPEYADGSPYRGEPTDYPANYEKLDITRMAGNLKGKMMIVYGDADENVPQSQAFRLVDALIRANKPYDLLYIPNGTHGTSGGALNGYTMQRRLDYFVEHLLGVEPPADVIISYGQ